MAKKSALGKGLGALIKQSETEISDSPVNATNKIDISKIETNPFQPRTYFDQEALEELAASIRQLGIIQPITVREIDGGKYQIISGERRFRAAQIAGLTEIPAYVRHADDNNMLELALVENIQREDLDAIEVAISYQRLIDECQLTQESVSERVGKKRSTVANYLRLLKLPAEVQLAIRDGKLSMGHARALVNVEETEQQIHLLGEIVDHGMSVRQVETAVRNLNNPEPIPVPEPIHTIQEEALVTRTVIDTGENTVTQVEFPVEVKQEAEKLIYEDPRPPVVIPGEEDEQHLKEQLSKCFGTKVDLKREPSGAGRIVIPFRTDDELQHILQMAGKMVELNS